MNHRLTSWVPAVCLAALAAACGSSAPALRPDAPAAQTGRFDAVGFLDQDVVAMAAYLAQDIPQIAKIRQTPAAQARVIVDPNEIRLRDDAVVLDRRAFADALLRQLRGHTGHQVRYIDRFEHTASNTGRTSVRASGAGGGGNSRGGGGRNQRESSSAAAAYYLMQVAVSSLPQQPGRPSAQRYDVQVIDASSRAPLWQGAFDLDRPERTAGHAPPVR